MALPILLSANFLMAIFYVCSRRTFHLFHTLFLWFNCVFFSTCLTYVLELNLHVWKDPLRIGEMLALNLHRNVFQPILLIRFFELIHNRRSTTIKFVLFVILCFLLALSDHVIMLIGWLEYTRWSFWGFVVEWAAIITISKALIELFMKAAEKGDQPWP